MVVVLIFFVMRGLPVALTMAFLASTPVLAQWRAPVDGGFTRSLGQPDIWKWTAGAGGGLALQGGRMVTDVRLGAFRDLVNPVLSLAGLHIETYLAARQSNFDAGVRARLVSPFARFGVGADWSRLAGTDFLLSLNHPVRRGGLFHDGTTLRIDYLPWRAHTLSVGFEKPILRPVPLGRTRPQSDQVRLARAGPPLVPSPMAELGLPAALTRVRDAAGWICRLTVVFLDHGGRNQARADAAALTALHTLERSMAISDGGELRRRSVDAEVTRYHAEIELAFSIALAGRSLPDGPSAAGRLVAAHARSILLNDVLLPYDGLFGQRKQHDSIREFGRQAQQSFERLIRANATIPADRAPVLVWVFASLLDIIEANRAALHEQWSDTRFIWLPLQLALLPEQHDTQAELDALIEQATGGQFTEGNFVSYAINEQYQYQLSRTIRQAEDYHVLWTHDVRGFDDHGQPDEMAYRQVLRSYLAALTERVRAYDQTGKLPVYIILLDEWFYQVNRGRLWMNLLEDPTRYRLRLPKGYESWQDSIAAAQSALRTAIDQSRRLQEQKRQFGEAWLRNLVKVHVNITNPADPSFWSRHLVPSLPVPDNMMRDHRKLVFYDITEQDPYRGEALYTGAGVGEHYSNLSWEERTLVVRGPALLGLKQAARQLLLRQGMPASEIPYHLQPKPKSADYDARIVRDTQNAQQALRAVDLHNGTGFATKDVNVVKAMLYTLMPPGSVIKIPDSLWNSAFWGAALCGAALRGVRVLIIAPAEANSPVPVFVALSRAQELLWRLLSAHQILGPDIAAAGGTLRIGVYSPTLAVTDIPAKVRAVQQTFADQVWLRELFGFPPSVYEVLGDLAKMVSGLAMDPANAPEFEYDPQPKLHLKANFFASREAWTLMARPEWGDLTWTYVMNRIAQVQTRQAAVRSFEKFPEVFIDVGGAEVQRWFAELDASTRERVVFYTVMGSQNQNYRSMVVDGEVAFLVSSWPSIIPYLDFISLIGQSRWIEDYDELARLLPRQPGWRWRFARWIKLTT